MRLLGIDTGGTFTDFVYLDNDRLITHKVLSTPDSPESAIIQGIEDLGMELSGLNLVHGSTVATNAVLEGKGAKTVYIGNSGLGDVLTIGRQTRRELYNLAPPQELPPVPAEYCLEVNCRISAQAEIIRAPGAAELKRLVEQVRRLEPGAVAVNLLFSFLDDSFEKRIAAALPKDIFVSLSCEVLREIREYERGITTWLNAYIGPLVQGYLERLERRVKPATVTVMRSSADTCSADLAGRQAVHLLLSGPAGGLAGAHYVGGQCGEQRLITLDMGGTSTDVALLDGRIGLSSAGHIGRYPVAVPMVDMHTIGAGGGSIARLDAAGGLFVGPESAGARPGPVCYGQGGRQVTVTDCNLVLGHMPASIRFGKQIRPDRTAAEKALRQLAAGLGLDDARSAAGSVVDLVNEHMLQALRAISIHKGIDPRDFTLCAFGGAGGLHVCALAEALQVARVLLPVHAGVLSALGMAVAPAGRQHSRTIARAMTALTAAELDGYFASLAAAGTQELRAQGHAQADIRTSPSLDLCYSGQAGTLNLPWDGDVDAVASAFEQLHEARFGHRLERQVDLATVRLGVTVAGQRPKLPVQTGRPGAVRTNAAGNRQLPRLHPQLETGQTGPLIVYDDFSTLWVAAGWSCRRDACGNLLLHRPACSTED